MPNVYPNLQTALCSNFVRKNDLKPVFDRICFRQRHVSAGGRYSSGAGPVNQYHSRSGWERQLVPQYARIRHRDCPGVSHISGTHAGRLFSVQRQNRY